MKNSDDCDGNGYVKIDYEERYIKSNGGDVSYNSKINYGRACYYVIRIMTIIVF